MVRFVGSAIAFRSLKRVQGDLVYMDLPGQPTLVLNTTKAAIDLLDKRAAIYSDRPISLTLKL